MPVLKKNDSGFVLLIVLLFLMVLTLMVVCSSQDIILENKMQNQLRNQARVFARAALGRAQVILAQEGDSFALPDSSIALTVTTRWVSEDVCGNQTIDIQSTAKNALSTVVLNSRDIFARVPREKGCRRIAAHQTLWWKECT